MEEKLNDSKDELASMPLKDLLSLFREVLSKEIQGKTTIPAEKGSEPHLTKRLINREKDC